MENNTELEPSIVASGDGDEIVIEPQPDIMAKMPIVRCAYTDLVDPKELKPHPANPNEHPPKQIEMFIQIMSFSGVRRPITVSKLSGFITKGHGQLEAYLKAGWSPVPVDFQEYESESQELADIAADNELQRQSAMNFGKLQHLLVHLDTGAFNMELTGFETKRLEKLFTTFKNDSAPALAGADGAPVVPQEHTINGGMTTEGGSPADGLPSSHVRMVQLFFTEQTVEEFMKIAEYFKNIIKTENVTDTVLEVMRSAFRSHNQHSESNPEANTPEVAASEGTVELPSGG